MTSADPSLVYRHKLPTRLWHWTNALCIYVLFTSGLGIFNAHPRLYWGEYGANFDPAWLVLDRFPGWLTLPEHYSLAMSRHWHLFTAPIFAFSLLAYMIWSLGFGHFRRDMFIGRREFTVAHIWQDIKDHARLKFPKGQAAARYNILQKIAYSKLLFLFLPVVILTGLAMSPGMDAAWPWLTQIWGGRQTARSVHFIAAWAIVIFFLVHIAMVVLAGPLNELRSMITGWFRLPDEKEDAA
ncbi:MAG: cytochrome b/b6 domain-containing protein [Sphingobium sp.]|nr:cytochrome b/b6 domain-containing protein [Sphingomonas sp.]